MPGFELIGAEEREAVDRLFGEEGGILFAHGFDAARKRYHVREFEAQAAQMLEGKHALAVSSGTAAVKIALKALGVGPGDEVITQAFNFIATVEAILDTGAKPVIANVDDTLNMDCEEAETLITPRTKVLLPVHMLGVPADMDKVMALAKLHDLRVLEDNAESLGAKYKGSYLGFIGDAGALSFDFGKIVTSGEGGMVITNTSAVDKYAREYHDHGHENNLELPRGRDTKTIFGFNYRMTEMQAAVGKEQLKKLDQIIRENKARYEALSSGFDKSAPLRAAPIGSETIHDTFIFFVDDKDKREAVVEFLGRSGFGTKNLPDAVEWHCAAYWHHALDDEQTRRAEDTRERLAKAIAVPIWLRKTEADYAELGQSLRRLI